MKNLLTVSRFTFIEVYRSKVMVSIIVLALALLILSYVASEFAYGAPAKVALDVGFGVMSLSNLAMSLFIGSTLLAKEIEQKTIYMMISRPISRFSFLTGKIIGLSSVLVINSLILGSLSSLLFVFYGGEWQSLFIWAICFSMIEAVLVMCIAVLFSLVTNTTLAIIFSLSLYVVGHAINETSKLVFTKMNMIFTHIVELSTVLIPNFYKLNLKDFLLYQQELDSKYLVYTSLYSLTYLAFLLVILLTIFKSKNLD